MMESQGTNDPGDKWFLGEPGAFEDLRWKSQMLKRPGRGGYAGRGGEPLISGKGLAGPDRPGANSSTPPHDHLRGAGVFSKRSPRLSRSTQVVVLLSGIR